MRESIDKITVVVTIMLILVTTISYTLAPMLRVHRVQGIRVESVEKTKSENNKPFKEDKVYTPSENEYNPETHLVSIPDGNGGIMYIPMYY